MAEPKGESDAGERRADVRTFLIADVRGYTRFTQEHGDRAASALAERFAEVVVTASIPLHGQAKQIVACGGSVWVSRLS